MRFKVLVLWSNGEEEFVAMPNGMDAIFTNRRKAQEIADGFKMGIDPKQVRAISVVKAK